MTITGRPHRLRTILLGAVLPLVALAVAGLLLAAWRTRLPDPVALHWGTDGVDRTGSFGALVLPFALLAVLLCLPMVAVALLVPRALRRGAVGLAAGTGVLAAGLAVASTLTQLDLADATAAPAPTASLALAITAALLIGLGAAWAAGGDPPLPATGPVPADAPRMDLPETATAVWNRPLPHPGSAALALETAPVLVAVVLGVVTGQWWLLLPMGLLTAVLIVMTRGRVRVDREGLTVHGLLGRVRIRVPAAEVVRADVVDVDPLRSYGGWGVRVGRDGSLGVVARRGEAVRVSRSEDRVVVVTVDDAATAAALLNTVAGRARTTAG